MARHTAPDPHQRRRSRRRNTTSAPVPARSASHLLELRFCGPAATLVLLLGVGLAAAAAAAGPAPACTPAGGVSPVQVFADPAFVDEQGELAALLDALDAPHALVTDVTELARPALLGPSIPAVVFPECKGSGTPPSLSPAGQAALRAYRGVVLFSDFKVRT